MKNLRKKMLFYFISIMTLAAGILTMMIFAIIYFTSNDLLATILTVISLVLLVILMKLYNNLTYLKHEFVLISLLENADKPVTSNQLILKEKFSSYLINSLNYRHHITNNNYSLYYKIAEGFSKKKRHLTLYSILIFKENYSFISDTSTNAFESLEKYLHKKEKYTQRVFIQLKETAEGFNENNINDTNKIFFLSHRKNNIVVINLLFDKKQQQVYYLHTKKIKLPIYLNIVYDEIKKLI